MVSEINKQVVNKSVYYLYKKWHLFLSFKHMKIVDILEMIFLYKLNKCETGC